MSLDTANKRFSMMGLGLVAVHLVMPVPDGGFTTSADRQQLIGVYAGISTTIPMTPIPARVPYRPPQVSAVYDPTQTRTQQALLARAIPPTVTRTVTEDTRIKATDDLLLCDTTAGDITVELLPAFQVQFLPVSIKNIGTGSVSVAGSVDGEDVPDIQSPEPLRIQSDGIAWRRLSPRPALPYDVRDAGAVGDGTTDDTDAIARALARHLVVFFPPEHTFLTGPIVITREGQTLMSTGATRPFAGNPISAGCIKLINGADDDLIYVDTVSGGQVLGLHLDGNEAGNTAGRAVVFNYNAFGRIIGCYIHDTAGDGVSLTLSDECRVLDTYIYRAGGNGLVGNSGDHIIDVFVEEAGDNGILCFNGYSWQVTGQVLSCTNSGFVAQGTAPNGVQRMEVDLHSRNNGKHGFHFINSQNCIVTGFGQANGQTTLDTYSGARVDDSNNISFHSFMGNDYGVGPGPGTSGVPQQKYGIELTGTTDEVSISGGALAGLTAPFVGVGFYKIRGVLHVLDAN